MVAGIRKAGGRPGDKWLGARGGKLGAGFDVKGYERATAIVKTRGPAQILYFGAPPHFIGARLLGTRVGLRRKSRRVGAMAAFGGSNRGAFGELMATSRVTRSGAVKQRAGKQALVFAGSGGPKAYAFHPGTKGENQWPWVKKQSAVVGSRRWQAAHRAHLARSFQ